MAHGTEYPSLSKEEWFRIVVHNHRYLIECQYADTRVNVRRGIRYLIYSGLGIGFAIMVHYIGLPISIEPYIGSLGLMACAFFVIVSLVEFSKLYKKSLCDEEAFDDIDHEQAVFHSMGKLGAGVPDDYGWGMQRMRFSQREREFQFVLTTLWKYLPATMKSDELEMMDRDLQLVDFRQTLKNLRAGVLK